MLPYAWWPIWKSASRFRRAGLAKAPAEFNQRIVVCDPLAVYRELAPIQAMRLDHFDGSAPCV